MAARLGCTLVVTKQQEQPFCRPLGITEDTVLTSYLKTAHYQLWSLCLVFSTTIVCQGELPQHFMGDGKVLTKAEIFDGWIALFDGESLYGWRPQKAANFEVKDGAIVVESGEQCLLCTTTQFSDYILRLDFRSDPTTNSGIFLRTSPSPKDVTHASYELNIAPQDNPFPTGSLVQRQKVSGKGGDDAWHTYEVTMDGGHVVIKLDGEQIMDYTDADPVGRGFIGLQHNSGRVEFKNIKLKPLGMSPLFNEKNLDDWTSYPNMASKFTVTPEGYLNLKHGKGQLESKGKYGDFVLQLEAITHGSSVNSGVFFRSIPGDEMMGYESQLQNGSPNPNELMPRTGSVVRRKLARTIAADDFEWFAKTIVAEGPHIAVWVNGYLVTDFVDRRKPNENPRRGLRTEPGTIIIQGHDEATEVTFRDLQISEMKPRH